MVGLCRACTAEMLFAAKSENTRSPQSCPQFQYYFFAANVTCISQFHYKISGRRFMCYDLHLLWHFSPLFVAFEHYFIDGIIILSLLNAECIRKKRANSFGSSFIRVDIDIVMVGAICAVCVYAIALAFTHCLPFLASFVPILIPQNQHLSVVCRDVKRNRFPFKCNRLSSLRWTIFHSYYFLAIDWYANAYPFAL